MKIKKYLPFFACLFILHVNLLAQEKLKFKFGKVNKEDFDISSPLIDSNTNAVVVASFGISEFKANPSERTFSLVFKKKERIKLINKNGFEAATITIPLYVSNDGKAEKLEDLKAYTYNLENDKVAEIKLDKDQVFTEKANKNWIYKKFTFPAVKEGSIIEYTYQVKSDFFFNFQSWEFQEKYPVLWSQYEAGIPEFFKYIILSQGYHQYDVNKTEESVVSYSFTEHVEREQTRNIVTGSGTKTFNVDGKLEYHTWVMKDVPGLKEEPFTTTTRNSVSKIEFQLQQIAYRGSFPQNYTNTWENLSRELMENDDFGVQINRPNNWLDKDVEIIVAHAVTQKEKANRIYEYVRDNFSCTNFNGYLINNNLKDIYKNKNGSVAEINMLLIAMMRSQKIEAVPVLLSTRNHGITNPYYPIIEKFNYVIAQIQIDSNFIYLDATMQRMPFGHLPLQVYNGHARVINKLAQPVYFEASSIKESSNSIVTIINNEKGQVVGSFNNNLAPYQSLELRNNIAKTTLVDYKKAFRESYPEDMLINNIEIDSLNLFDEPVSVKFDFNLKAFGDADIVYFNPLMGEAINKNLFAAEKRFYPVEMPYTIEKNFIFNMAIPVGYKVEELPKSARVKLNENEGMFEYIIINNGKTIQLMCRLEIKKVIFLNEDYQSLRDFYGFIVKKEAEQIVFKKIK